ncbi:DivIVA domain-containing protein [Demequina sp. SO4-18]|uniref:DivIVA domain-containing protein n=1 Tax=Demequina sp. SO4-18 TaxID=3401026 RepID=UPI003B58BDF5
MALLTAEDVLNKAFSKTKYREGFDQDEVDDFLDEVAHTVQSLTAERDDLAKRLAQAQAGAPASSEADSAAEPSTEGGLLAAATDPTPPSATGMLAMAQKLHDEYVHAGETERDRLIDDAKSKAESIVEQAETDAKARMDELVSERSELERKIDDLRRFERDYRARLKSYLENLLGDLDHGGKAEPAASSAPAFGAGFGAGVSASDDASDESEGDSVPAFEQSDDSQQAGESSDDTAQTGDSFSSYTPQSTASAPSAPSSPWAQVRSNDGDSSPRDDAQQEGVDEDGEQPNPWGASAYQPLAGPPNSDVSRAFGSSSPEDGDTKNS